MKHHYTYNDEEYNVSASSFNDEEYNVFFIITHITMFHHYAYNSEKYDVSVSSFIMTMRSIM